MTAWQRLKESESVTIGLRKESISTVLKDLGREFGTEGHISARTGQIEATVLLPQLLILSMLQLREYSEPHV